MSTGTKLHGPSRLRHDAILMISARGLREQPEHWLVRSPFKFREPVNG